MLLPAPDGPTSATRSPAATRNETPPSDCAARAGYANRTDSNAIVPARRLRQGERLGRRRDRRTRPEDLAEALGRARRRRELAVHLGELAEGARREDGIEQELRQAAGRHAVRQHVLGPVPEDAARRSRR